MKNKRLMLLLLLLVGAFLLPGIVSAQYSVVVDDNFTRANTTVGTVTGPGTFNAPSIGAAYVTTGTATWQISSDTLTGQAPGTTDGIEQCLRPTTENELNGKVAITFTLNTALASAYCATARYQSGLAYEAYYYQNGSSAGNFDIAIFTGSGQTRLVSNTSLTLTNGASYIIVLTCNGASPTVLGATIAAASAPSTILATLTYSDSTASLQATGQWGLTGATPAGTPTVFTHLTIYSVSASPTISVSPTTATAGANETITITGANLTTLWTTTAPTFTTSLGTLSAETVTSATTVTFTLAPGSSAGTATLADTSDTGSPTSAIVVNAAMASAYTTTGPTSGTVSVTSTNFTVTPNGVYTGAITPSVSSGPTGTFSPTSLTWSATSAAQTFTFTPSTTGTSVVTTTSSPTVTNTSGSISYVVAAANSLTMGTFTASPSPSGIILSVSSSLSGGSGSGYSYHVFRSTSPPIVVTGTPTFAVSSMPYTDTTATPGTTYYYKLVGVDGAADVAYAAPAGESGVSSSTATGLTVAAEYSATILNLVYMGDSITAGSTLSSPSTQAPPVTCSAFLASMYGIRNAFYTNEGYSGYTTNSFLPTVNTSNCYSNSVSAMAALEAANPGTEVFSVMLGTNDSAQSVTAAQVGTNLETIISSLLTSFPSAYVVMNEPILYTANQGNGYSETGLGFLLTYYVEYPIVAAYESALHPGHVLIGETDAGAFFANSYITEMTAQSGTNGYYFIHPNQQGASDLGRLWANGIYKALFGGTVSPTGRGRTLK